MDAIRIETVVSTWQGKFGGKGKTTVPADVIVPEGAEANPARIRKIVAYLNARLDRVTFAANADGNGGTYKVFRDGSTTHEYLVNVMNVPAPADEPAPDVTA